MRHDLSLFSPLLSLQIGTEADSYLECLQLMQDNLNARDEYLTFVLPDNTVLSHVIQRGGKFKMDFPRVILANYLEVGILLIKR